MNKVNNKKKKTSQEKIKKAFLQFIERYEINEITVTDICKLASINRSTFYSNYLDVYDLAEKIKEEMFHNVLELYKEEASHKKHSYDYLKLFKHMKENQSYYKILFKLDFDFSKYYNNHLEEQEALKFYQTTKHLEYHMEFFKAGMNAILRKWIHNDCKETPEEIAEILKSEYQKKNTIDTV